MIKKFVVEKDFHNTRFDRWFKNNVLDIPQGLIEKIIRKNQAKVNGKKTKSSYRVQENTFHPILRKINTIILL